METIASLLLGVGLSAACGLRIFLPLFVMSLASKLGLTGLSEGFEWIGSWAAFVGFGSACAVEVVAYYVPWLDHALDTIATPAAFVAGTVATASHMGDFHPAVGWGTAMIAGGGLATTIKAGAATTRVASTATTGGLGNHVVSTIENVGAMVLSVVAILVPALIGVLLVTVVLAVFAWRRSRRLRASVALA